MVEDLKSLCMRCTPRRRKWTGHRGRRSWVMGREDIIRCNRLPVLYRDTRLQPGRLQDSIDTTFVYLAYLVYGSNES